ncbi:hypothetical protein D1007_29721 [Hordeum vulgare]|nr:hypothetical protein D1007_29721 [Hordeum vulgare]
MSESVNLTIYYGHGNVRYNELGVDLSEFKKGVLTLSDPDRLYIRQLKHWLTTSFGLDPRVCSVSIHALWTKSCKNVKWELMPIDRSQHWLSLLSRSRDRRIQPYALVQPVAKEENFVQVNVGYEPDQGSQVAETGHETEQSIHSILLAGSGVADGDEEGDEMQRVMEEENEDGSRCSAAAAVVIVLRCAAVLVVPLPWVAVANGVGRSGRILVVVIEDDDAVLLAVATPGGDLLKGAALALHLLSDIVVPHPFEGGLVGGCHVEVLLLEGRNVGSVFGLMRREEASGSLVMKPPLRVHRPSGISCGSGLTGRSAGDPPKERERDPDEVDDPVSIRLGIQELPRRREKTDGGGFRVFFRKPDWMRAIYARRSAPRGGGGTGTPLALSLHEPGTRMSGGAG